MHCVGICGSDLHLYTTGRCGLETLSSPVVLGHEGAGVVVEVGSKVTNLIIGDRVAIEPTQPCRSCAYCRDGRYNLCEQPCYCSTTEADGNISTYYKHVADFCHKLPDNLSMEEGAAVQPLAIAVHACSRAGLRLGATLLVLGAGPVGVLCALTARAMGASKILMTDVVKSRVETAKTLVGCDVLLMKPEYSDEELARRVVEALGGTPDVTIDACGHESAQRLAMTVTRSGGVVLVVGIGAPRVSVPLSAALLREVDVRGSFRLLNSYPKSLAALSSGTLDLKSFITHHYPMEKTKEALEFAKTEVLIKMHCVGICGSDLHLYTTGRCGLETLSSPVVLGHEGAGVVVEVGSKVTNLIIGDRVAIEPTQPCRSCAYCRDGRYNLCEQPCYCSTTEADGNISTYYKHVADFCHKLPDNLSMEEGAAVQPLAIAVHACSRAGLRLGATLLVLGAGPVGVLCALTARAMGASKILMTDVVKSRVETAKTLVGCDVLLMKPEYSDEELARRVVEALGGTPDVTIDACGHESAQRLAMTVTRSGGVVLVVGIGAPRVSVPLSAALLREVDVRGSFRLLNSYPKSLAALSSGTLDLKSFITHHYPMEKTKEALEFAKTGEAMKIIIHL